MILGTLNLIAETESQRLEKLREYEIVDTHSEDTFDNIAMMASQIFGTTSSFISFVDEKKVFFKSNISNSSYNEVSREDSLCSIAIAMDNDVTVFNDTYDYPELMTNPYVKAEDGIRFYASAVLKSPEGFNMGTICVVDYRPREATSEQLSMLKTLSKLVIDKLENRLRYRKIIQSQINLMNITLHEIKNPLASINLANDILIHKAEKRQDMAVMIKSSVQRIQSKLNELLKQSEKEDKDLVLAIERVNLHELFLKLISNFELLANRKNQKIRLDYPEDLPAIYADKAKISDVLHNLVSNAIKYSYNQTTISISARENNGFVKIEVRDEGQGLNQDDMDKLFKKFAKLSSKPTGKETSNGLGLSITKSFVELHKGSIQALSDGKDKGTTFVVSLPIQYQGDASII
ncbi:sensor histidine kinase [Flavobacterium suaedae]|uniref:histidine kinase n=1 Tax=Flavobacterium suaedae TaxID=1767027 RepID=A0ABQ1K251_9FLAO|nr:HAMP domain-containing sensor histidine kinase [Flavobacterium suaedae]GGB80833.1 sensor histidine kinase [Flavobacterium suaedae]